MSGKWESGPSRRPAGFDAERISAPLPTDCRTNLQAHEGLLAHVRSTIRNGREGTDRQGAVWPGSRCEVYVLMKGRSGGLTRFEIIGTTLEQLVFAAWDGSYLTLSSELWCAFSSSTESFETFDRPSTCTGDPRTVALRLVRSLDFLFSIEYSVWCDRAQDRRSWHFEKSPCNRLVGGPVVKEGRR